MNKKAIIEKRNETIAKMEEMLNTCETETRSLTEEENTAYKALQEEIRALDETLAAFENLPSPTAEPVPSGSKEERAAQEEHEFAEYIRGKVTEFRDNEQNFNMSNNAAIIPSTIAQRIIKAVEDRCAILTGAERYNVRGTLKIPVYGPYTDASSVDHDITVAYSAEFSELTADAGKFTSIDLTGYLAGALTLIGVSLLNNADVDVVNFVVNHMADKIAGFLEGELLKGSGSANSHATGILSIDNTKTAAATNAVTADELIELQAKVKQIYQSDCRWVMNEATFTKIKEMKDGDGRYLIQRDMSAAFPYTLLGKPVEISDNMPTMAASAKAIYYGSYKALAVNFRENVGIQILREKYATMHAIGVVAWMEFDSKVIDKQRGAVLVMAAS